LKTRIIYCLILCGFFTNTLQSQEFVEKITEFFEFNIGKEREDPTFKQSKFVFAPIVAYEPSTNWGFGVGAKFLFKPFGAGADTRTSNMPLSVKYTLNNQFLATSDYTIFFPHENYLLKGKIGFAKFPISYFGIGSDTQDTNKREISFNNFIIEPLLLKKISDGFFVGGGWRYNTYNSVDEILDDENDVRISIDDEYGTTSSGFEFALTFDTRNNVLNASEGIFSEFTHGFYDKALGSSQNFMLTKFDFRKYWQFSERRPDDSFAFQTYGRFSWNETPILELSSLGGAELLRGYQEDRFRDRHAFFTQAEYRWQALERIGFVFYTGAGNVASKIEDMEFKNLKYSLGTGIRLKIVKSENLNIRVDYAVGLGSTSDRNFYLGIAESF